MFPREKRPFDHAYHNEGKRARPLSSEVLEAVRQDLLLKLSSKFEPMIRRVVAEEIDRALTKNEAEWRMPPKQIIGSPARKFRLQFMTTPKSETYTESKLEGEHGDTIRVVLLDASNGQPVTTGPESVAQLEVVPLMGDFDDPDEEDWTANVFESHVEKAREGKGPLLVGELRVNLKGGVGTLGQLSITDNSSWTRSKKFRLGVKVAQDYNSGEACIREAKTPAFIVKESRGIAYQKHHTPAPDDDVWRLRNIGKGGPFHRKLIDHGIRTVKDFLVCNQINSGLLKEVLGKMSAKQYQATVEHAKNCVLKGKLYIYRVNQPPYETVIFNDSYQTVGAVANGQYVRFDKLDEIEKVRMDALIKSAYDHWGMNVTEYAIEDFTTAVNVTEHTVEGFTTAEELFIEERPQYVEDLPVPVNDMEPTAIQAPHEYWDGNATMEATMTTWNPQGHSGMFEVGCSSQHAHIQASYADDHDGVDVGNPTIVDWGTIANVDVGRPTIADEGVWGTTIADGDAWVRAIAEGDAISTHRIGSYVEDVMREYHGFHTELPSLDPSPTPAAAGRWLKRPEWLRIRTVIRCALFIRQAAAINNNS